MYVCKFEASSRLRPRDIALFYCSPIDCLQILCLLLLLQITVPLCVFSIPFYIHIYIYFYIYVSHSFVILIALDCAADYFTCDSSPLSVPFCKHKPRVTVCVRMQIKTVLQVCCWRSSKIVSDSFHRFCALSLAYISLLCKTCSVCLRRLSWSTPLLPTTSCVMDMQHKMHKLSSKRGVFK